jgi:aspartate/methionine/tyrosine aminotransferase
MREALEKIPGLHVAPPEGAFYYFVDVSEFGNATEIARRLLEDHQVIVIPGEAFGRNATGFLRISFAASESRIRDGIARIAAELES